MFKVVKTETILVNLSDELTGGQLLVEDFKHAAEKGK